MVPGDFGFQACVGFWSIRIVWQVVSGFSFGFRGGFGWFKVVSGGLKGGFGWFQVVSGGFRYVRKTDL